MFLVGLVWRERQQECISHDKLNKHSISKSLDRSKERILNLMGKSGALYTVQDFRT